MHPKIIIIGCGLSGMITALKFAQHNIPTLIVERRKINDQKFLTDPRTTALTASSKYFFQKMQIWEEISPLAGCIKDIYVVDNKDTQILHFAPDELKSDESMGYLIENHLFKKALLSLTIKHQLIDIIDNTNYKVKENSADKCVLSLDDNTDLCSDLLIVCDGNKSLVKQKYFTNEIDKDYSQYALTFIVKHEKPHEGTAIEHFMPGGPFAILPLHDQHLSSIVWTVSPAMKDNLLTIPADEFLYFVQENFGEFLGKIEIKGEIAAFSLRASLTARYFNKRIALVADSAHVIHPLAGQGLNQGIKDIDSIITHILADGVSNNSLKQYESDRKSDNNIMFEITDNINFLFSDHSKILHSFRQFGFYGIEKIPKLKKYIVKYAMGRR
jgi:2-octaprenyl-6-methoxyphenol hydroxylase